MSHFGPDLQPSSLSAHLKVVDKKINLRKAYIMKKKEPVAISQEEISEHTELHQNQNIIPVLQSIRSIYKPITKQKAITQKCRYYSEQVMVKVETGRLKIVMPNMRLTALPGKELRSISSCLQLRSYPDIQNAYRQNHRY